MPVALLESSPVRTVQRDTAVRVAQRLSHDFHVFTVSLQESAVAVTEGVPPDPFCYPVPVSPHFECDDEAPVRDNGTIVLHEVIEWRDCLELRLPDLDINRASLLLYGTDGY